MAKPATHLADTILIVDPGSSATTRLTLRNNSPSVGQYRIFIPEHFPASKWVAFRRVEEDAANARPSIEISLLELDEVDVVVTFAPPHNRTTPAGDSPYVIAVEALESDQDSTSAEGSLDISPISATRSRVVPAAIAGRAKGQYRLSVRNEGTTATKVRLLAADFDPEALSIAWAPKQLEIRPGNQGDFLVEARVRKLLPIGKPEQHTANLSTVALGRNGAPQPGASHGVSFEQKPWVPVAVLPVVAALVIAAGILLYPRGGGRGLEDPPNPPQNLVAVPSPEEVLLSWVSDPRSVQTDVQLIPCDQQNSLTVAPLAVASFEEVTTGALPLPSETAADLCLRARSIDSEGQASIFGDITTATIASTDIEAPTGVRLDGDQLSWNALDGLEYEPIINNEPFGSTFLTSPIEVASLQLPPGENTVHLRATNETGTSPVSEPVTIDIAEEAAVGGETTGDGGEDAPGGSGEIISTPWIMFATSSQEIDDEDLQNLQALVAAKAGSFANRATEIEVVELAVDHPSPGENLVWMLGNEEILLAGRSAIAHAGGGLTLDEAIEFCDLMLAALADAAQSQDGRVPFTCVVFDGSGKQITESPAAQAAPPSSSIPSETTLPTTSDEPQTSTTAPTTTSTPSDQDS